MTTHSRTNDNSMYSSLDSLEADVLKKIELADFSSALDLIIQFVQQVIGDPKTTAVIFGSERLDRLCLTIGSALVRTRRNPVADNPGAKNNDSTIVTLATHLDRYGGHTLVVEDIIRAQPDKSHIILLTDLFNLTDTESLAERFSPIAEFRVAPHGSAFEKMEWLLDQLWVIRPDRIILFNHHEDVVAIACMQPWLDSSKIIFYHHADHTLCLGVHLPRAIHIDPHNIGYENCRAHERLKNNRYLPLTVQDKGVRPAHLEFISDGILRTCSSGTSNKFFQPYSYLYREMIAKVLAIKGGFHFHVGNLSDDEINSILTRLVAAGIDTQRFVHIAWVPSLWSMLIENRIDLYISSFPLGGGRASIEAMGSGTPLLIHESYLSRFHGGADIAYPEAFVWRNPLEFYKHIDSINPDALEEHSKWARQHYEANHLPSIMASELEHICREEQSLTPLPLRYYIPDELQKYLHANANQTSLLEKTLTERDDKISGLHRAASELSSRIAKLNQAVIERDREIANLGKAVAERDHRIADINQATIERGNGIPALDEAAAERDERIAYLDHALIECDSTIANLDQAVIERDNRIANLDQAIVERDSRIANPDQALIERDNTIANLDHAQFEANARITALENSTSWKMTFPLRRLLVSTPTLRKFCRRTAKMIWWASTFQLGNRLREWARDIELIETPHFAPPTNDYCLAVPLDYSVDKWESAPRVAVICHMFYAEMADEFQRYLVNIPFPFDLFITTDSQEKRSAIENEFSQWDRGEIEVRIAPNRGRDIAPKLVACRDAYDKYEFVLHIHTKKSPHSGVLIGWRFYLLETLLGSEKIVESIFESFRSDRKLGMIAPQHFAPVHHFIGWGWNFQNAKTFARRIGVKISPNGRVDFPSGSMFWARTAALRPLLDCNLSLDEFPREEGQNDGTLGHVIERLYFFVCERAGYRWIKISQSSLPEQAERIKHVKNQKELLNFIKNTQYELLKSRILQFLSSLLILRKSGDDASSQQRKIDHAPAKIENEELEIELGSDVSNYFVPLLDATPLANKPVRLIAFYLPQFHAIPENDDWWGNGFTEWTNVQPAQPEFVGHYQPHVPGELGYYNLLDLSVQHRQVELAKLYGIEGFCFYFYWFGGKRLLEIPIENYLNEPSLDLPFCLCWANENWSRRWDGLDSEILIAQQHSPEDDLAFIENVARYMRDERYIRIDGKPLLLVYRPNLLPSPIGTSERWRAWCRANGMGEVYLAYTQSFETVDPAIYGFDAAVEFPPNNSAVPNVTQSVKPLRDDFNSIVYDWRALAERSDHYTKPEYTLFRGVCPSWDNTARRKNKSSILLNSSPHRYQKWLYNAIGDTCERFTNPNDRLVFINAWNEWAEGAHLEPDQRYGYAYLEATRMALVRRGL